MRIIAESKPIATMPYVHLGYTAASHVRLFGGFTLTGIILAVIGVKTAIRFVNKSAEYGKTWIHWKFRRSWATPIGLALVGAGVGCAVFAWVSGDRYYPAGERMTRFWMERTFREMWMMVEGPAGEGPTGARRPGLQLPTEPGIYNVATALGSKYECLDGWRKPMRLKVVLTDGQDPEYILMSAGKDRKWDTEDDRTSEEHVAGWRETWKEQRALAARAREERGD